MTPTTRFVAALITAAVACGIWSIAYQISKDNCEKRGEHVEWIYGSRGSWTCDGADR